MYSAQRSALDSDFWSSVYRDRAIATLNRNGRWHVYLDHALQHNMVFATAGDARTWLIKRIDQKRARGDRHALAA
jgi:hypothetical protein